jgi:hypothetical protein
VLAALHHPIREGPQAFHETDHSVEEQCDVARQTQGDRRNGVLNFWRDRGVDAHGEPGRSGVGIPQGRRTGPSVRARNANAVEPSSRSHSFLVLFYRAGVDSRRSICANSARMIFLGWRALFLKRPEKHRKIKKPGPEGRDQALGGGRVARVRTFLRPNPPLGPQKATSRQRCFRVFLLRTA